MLIYSNKTAINAELQIIQVTLFD